MVQKYYVIQCGQEHCISNLHLGCHYLSIDTDCRSQMECILHAFWSHRNSQCISVWFMCWHGVNRPLEKVQINPTCQLPSIRHAKAYINIYIYFFSTTELNKKMIWFTHSHIPFMWTGESFPLSYCVLTTGILPLCQNTDQYCRL